MARGAARVGREEAAFGAMLDSSATVCPSSRQPYWDDGVI
jgi:hypothetical protein